MLNRNVRAHVELTTGALVQVDAWLSRSAEPNDHVWWGRMRKRLKVPPSANSPAQLLHHFEEWEQTLGSEDEARNSLAEIRALGALLSTSDGPTQGLLPRARLTSNERTSDFLVGQHQEVFLEVCCARMNDVERERQSQLDEIEHCLQEKARAAAREAIESASPETAALTATASASWLTTEKGVPKTGRHHVSATIVRRTDGTAPMFTIAFRDIRPEGPKKSGPGDGIHTLASIFASKKRSSDQIPEGKPGILWMDLCDPDWSIHAIQTAPVELFWKGMNLASAGGIWHSFYGRKGQTLMMERAVIGRPIGRERQATLQPFDGRFREDEQGRRWSAAVLRCVDDALVIFEHPNPIVPLPFGILRELVSLHGYRPEVSFHRFAEDDFAGLQRRLDDVDNRLAFYAP